MPVVLLLSDLHQRGFLTIIAFLRILLLGVELGSGFYNSFILVLLGNNFSCLQVHEAILLGQVFLVSLVRIKLWHPLDDEVDSDVVEV
jgi:hypothetical protein